LEKEVIKVKERAIIASGAFPETVLQLSQGFLFNVCYASPPSPPHPNLTTNLHRFARFQLSGDKKKRSFKKGKNLPVCQTAIYPIPQHRSAIWDGTTQSANGDVLICANYPIAAILERCALTLSHDKPITD
jgi:hypothetical protein